MSPEVPAGPSPWGSVLLKRVEAEDTWEWVVGYYNLIQITDNMLLFSKT